MVILKHLCSYILDCLLALITNWLLFVISYPNFCHKKLIWIFVFAKQILNKNLHYLSFNVHALLRQLVYSITSFSVCQDFFKSFLKKFFNSFSTRTLLFPCSLALSTDDLIIIHSITTFVNTFFQLFSSFFIFLFATLYIVDYFLLYILFSL